LQLIVAHDSGHRIARDRDAGEIGTCLQVFVEREQQPTEEDEVQEGLACDSRESPAPRSARVRSLASGHARTICNGNLNMGG
jgi:hypothetical protein